MKATLRAVLFDFDGTLTPSLPLWLEAYHIALRTFGMTLSDEEVLRRCFFRDWQNVAADLGACTAIELEAEVNCGLDQSSAAAELFPLARDVIDRCREHGLRTALVTSSPRRLIDTVAMNLGVHHLFDFIICGGRVPNYKPHPEPHRRCARPGLGGRSCQDSCGRSAQAPAAIGTNGPAVLVFCQALGSE